MRWVTPLHEPYPQHMHAMLRCGPSDICDATGTPCIALGVTTVCRGCPSHPEMGQRVHVFVLDAVVVVVFGLTAAPG